LKGGWTRVVWCNLGGLVATMNYIEVLKKRKNIDHLIEANNITEGCACMTENTRKERDGQISHQNVANFVSLFC
jgi:hypothetical protein